MVTVLFPPPKGQAGRVLQDRIDDLVRQIATKGLANETVPDLRGFALPSGLFLFLAFADIQHGPLDVQGGALLIPFRACRDGNPDLLSVAAVHQCLETDDLGCVEEDGFDTGMILGRYEELNGDVGKRDNDRRFFLAGNQFFEIDSDHMNQGYPFS